MRIIDADGHVNDGACAEEIARYMPEGNRTSQVFPPLDHLHFYYLKLKRVPLANPGPQEWIEFLDRTGIEWTALYPTFGLAAGRIVSVDWAVAASRAYNNWLCERFTKVSPRLKGMALIPEPFVFGSDFPHEAFDAYSCRREIDELLEREDLTERDKEDVLGGNALRLYQTAEKGLSSKG